MTVRPTDQPTETDGQGSSLSSYTFNNEEKIINIFSYFCKNKRLQVERLRFFLIMESKKKNLNGVQTWTLRKQTNKQIGHNR